MCGNPAGVPRVLSCKISPMAKPTVSLCLAVALLIGAAPALAHVTPEPAPAVAPLPAEALDGHMLIATTSAPPGPWTMLALGALAAVVIGRRRRIVALLSVAVLLLIAFEAGLHSVHHIGDRDSSTCVIASASAQTGGVTIASIAFERAAEVAATVVVRAGNQPTSRPAAPDLGRAPPTV